MNVPLADKEIGMLKFDYPEDYTGTNLNHRKISEKRKLTDATSRLVTLDYGSFFVESLVIRNVATGRLLTPGKDFACVELDTLATERSGRQVCTAILVENQQVEDIGIDYIFVGGQHMSGLHLMKELKAIYPNGLEPRYHWENILNKPETFKSKTHQTHVKELYGFDGINHSLQEMIDGLSYKDSQYIDNTFSKVMTKLNEMNVQLDNFIADTQEALNQAFEDFRVQDNEYIFTNTKENPTVKRGYGNWILVNNSILKGDNGNDVYAVGQDSVISLGTKQIVTNCYVWKNQNASKSPSYTIQAPTHAGLASTQRNENQDIVFNISTTNLAAGSKIAWVVVDEVTKVVVSPSLLIGAPAGEVVTDAQGKASVVIKFRPDVSTPQANRKYTFRLLKSAASFYTFTVMDSSLEKRIELSFTVDAAGKFPITEVNENQEFFLQIKYVGMWVQGEVIFLNWSASGIPVNKLIGAPLKGVVPSSPSETYSLKVQANSLNDNKQALIVYALQDLKDVISSDKPHTQIEVIDTSRFSYASITFNDVTSNKTNVVRIDEDVSFDIVVDTNLADTELNLVYNTTKSIADFSGLRSAITTNAQGKAIIHTATLADFLTNVGAQSITVSVEINNTIIGYNTLFINDTSKTPDYQVFFSKADVTQVITSINEGEKFFLNVRVPGWLVGAKAPSLEFNYTLNEVNDTSLEDLKARLLSTFYPAMLFDQSSQTYNEVTWINGDTLRMEFTAVADKTIKGDAKFGVMVKQSNQSQFDKVTYLTIYDTSIPTVVGSWSSSPTVLTPITQVSEMQSNGLNQRCYLWIDVDGDGASFGNITLKSNSVNGVDFVTLFPNTIKLANGATRHIVTVDAKADFVAEGNKSLYVAGSYKNDRGQDVELFRSTITLVDNSILTELNGVTSTSASVVVGGNGFSEWVPFYIHMDYPAFAFDTQIEWQVTFTSNPSGNDQLEVLSGTIEVARNSARSVLTLTPIKDRLQDGGAIFDLSFKRKIKATGQYITAEKQLLGIEILDDSLPMSVELKAYTDEARTIAVGHTVNEGTKLYLRAVVKNPDRNYSVGFAVKYQTATQISISGPGTVVALPNTAVPSRIEIDDRRIAGLVPGTPGTSTVNIDAEVTVVADRTTRNNGTIFVDGMAIEARVYDNSSNSYPIGTVVPFAQASSANSGLAVAFNDTSKTAAYNVITPSSVNEDTAFKLFLEVADGTVGDVYYPVLISGINANRLSINELGLEQLASTAVSSHSWNFKVAPDYITTGPFTLNFGFINKTTGKQVITKKVTLNDTTYEPDINVTLGAASDVYWALGDMVEGTTHEFRVSANNSQFYPGETIKIEWVSGRAASEFTGLFGSHVLAEGNLLVKKNVSLRRDRKTNTADENVVVIKVTAMYSNTSKNVTIKLIDISKTPAITSAVWKNSTGQVVTQVREGDTVYLEVLAAGGPHAYNLKLDNSGGRSISRLDSNEYGITKNRTSDTVALNWSFKVKQDGITNNGAETMLRVRLYSPDADVPIDTIYSLPIYDNSRGTSGVVQFRNEDNTTNISAIEEGKNFVISYSVTDPDPDGDAQSYRLLLVSSRANDGWNTDVKFNAVSGTVYTQTRRTALDATTNSTTALNIEAQLWDMRNNRLLASDILNLIDVSRSNIAASDIRIVSVNGTTHLNSTDEGNTVQVFIPATAFSGVDWTKETMKLKLNLTNMSLAQANETIITTSNRQGDGSFRWNIVIPANELTAPGQQLMSASLFHLFNGYSGEYLRGTSNNTIVNDTSVMPSIDAVFLSKDGNPNTATAISQINEGESFYVHVKATGLMRGGSTTSVNLNWSGTATADDFNSALPSSVTVNMVDGNGYKYEGVEGPFQIKADGVDG